MSTSGAVSKQLAESDSRALTPLPETGRTLPDIVVNLREKFRARREKDNSEKNLPVVYDFNHDVSASRLLAHKFPTAFIQENYEKSRRELQYILLGLIGFVLVTYIGWAAISQINYLQGGGFVYNTGLIGGILMLASILYAVYKRSNILRRLISPEIWYYTHISVGAMGALLIVLHSSFNLKSINSSIAFISMLLVIISGALGRYLYTQFTYILHKRYNAIKEQEPTVFDMVSKYECGTANRIRRRMSRFALHCLKQPKDVQHFVMRCFSVFGYGAYLYLKCAHDLRQIINSIATLADLNDDDVRQLKKSQMQQLRYYMLSIVQMGYVSLLEQLFRHWRVLHVPMLYLLVITSVAHVVVVHMY